MKRYKLDKTVAKTRSHSEGERDKLFPPEVSLPERLYQAWYLTCEAYSIDPGNPPPMQKKLTYMGKHR